jgi:hypothetical protein
LTGGGGHETFVGFSGGSTTFKDTAALLNGDTINNFTAPGDVLDFTTVVFSKLHPLTFVENGTNTAGTLTVSDGTHTASVTLTGPFSPSNFHVARDALTGTAITYHS